MASLLPEGFVLDDEPTATLPEGFALEPDSTSNEFLPRVARGVETGVQDVLGGANQMAADVLRSRQNPYLTKAPKEIEADIPVLEKQLADQQAEYDALYANKGGFMDLVKSANQDPIGSTDRNLQLANIRERLDQAKGALKGDVSEPFLGTLSRSAEDVVGEVPAAKEAINKRYEGYIAPYRDTEFWNKVADSLGQSAPSTVVTMANQPLGLSLMYAQTYGQARNEYEESQKKKGLPVDDEKAAEYAFNQATAQTPLELVGDVAMAGALKASLGSLFKAGAPAAGKIVNWIKNTAFELGKAAAGETLITTPGQSLAEDLIAEGSGVREPTTGWQKAGNAYEQSKVALAQSLLMGGGPVAAGATIKGGLSLLPSSPEKAASQGTTVPPVVAPPTPAEKVIVQQASEQSENLRANNAPETAKVVEELAATVVAGSRLDQLIATPEERLSQALDALTAKEPSAETSFAPPTPVDSAVFTQEEAGETLSPQEAAKERVGEALATGNQPAPEDIALAEAVIEPASDEIPQQPPVQQSQETPPESAGATPDTVIPAQDLPPASEGTVPQGGVGQQDVDQGEEKDPATISLKEFKTNESKAEKEKATAIQAAASAEVDRLIALGEIEVDGERIRGITDAGKDAVSKNSAAGAQTGFVQGSSKRYKAIIKKAVKENKPVSAEGVDELNKNAEVASKAMGLPVEGIKLPEGYTRQGDLYVYAPKETLPASPSPAPVEQISEAITPVEPVAEAIAEAPAQEVVPKEEPFLSYPEWVDKYGEKFEKPRYTPGKMGVVNTERSQKIAAGKNAKIADRNRAAYVKYAESHEAKGEVPSGQSNHGGDRFEEYASWVSQVRGKEAAEKVLAESGKYEKTKTGKWSKISSKQNPSVKEEVPAGNVGSTGPGNASTTKGEDSGQGNTPVRIQLKAGPQSYEVLEKLPQSKVEKANNEQYFRIKNERTGAEQTVEQNDIAREIKPKSEKVKSAIKKLPAKAQKKAEAATEVDTSPDPYQGAPLTDAAPLTVEENLDLLSELASLGVLDEGSTGATVLQAIVDSKRTPQWAKTLAARLLALNPTMDVKAVNRPSSTWQALYSSTEGQGLTQINLARRHSDGVIPAILHESSHHITLEQIRNPENLKGEAKKAYDDLVKIFKDISSRKEFQGEYGVSSVEEMVAEAFSNAGFRAKLDRIKSGSTTVWQKLVNAIARLLFNKPAAETSLLHQAVEAAFTLAGAPIVEAPSNGTAAMAESGSWPSVIGNPSASTEAEAKALTEATQELESEGEIDTEPLSPERRKLLEPRKATETEREFNPLGLATFWANKFNNIPGTDFNDRQSEAIQGLVKAARNYNFESSVPFFNYANTIIQNHLRDYSKSRKVRSKYVVSDSPVAEDEGETIISTAKSSGDIFSSPIPKSASKELFTEPSPDDVSIHEKDKQRMRDLAKDALSAVMAKASERDRNIIKDYASGMTMREVALENNVSPQGVLNTLRRYRESVEKALFLRGVTLSEILAPMEEATEPAVPTPRNTAEDEQQFRESTIGQLEGSDIERSEPVYGDESTPEEIAEAVVAARNLPNVSDEGMVPTTGSEQQEAFRDQIEPFLTGHWPNDPSERRGILKDHQAKWLASAPIRDFLNRRMVELSPVSDNETSNLRYDNADMRMEVGGAILNATAGRQNVTEVEAKSAVSQEINEEVIHAAHIGWLKDQWQKSGSLGSFEKYVTDNADATIQSIVSTARTLPYEDAKKVTEALVGSARIYFPNFRNASSGDIVKLVMGGNAGQKSRMINEFIRQMVQLRATDQITETSSVTIFEQLSQWVADVLKSLRWASRNIDGFGTMFATQIRATEDILASTLAPTKGKGIVAPMAEKRSQVGGVQNIGHQYEPTSMKATTVGVRENIFDSTKEVSEEQTETAWNFIQALSDTGGIANQMAGSINGRVGNIAGTAMTKVELLRYAVKIAAQNADRKMLNYLMASINLMPNSEEGMGESQAGLVLRVRSEFESPSLTAQKGYISQSDEVTSRMLAGRNNNEKDIQFVKELRDTLQQLKVDDIAVLQEIYNLEGEKRIDIAKTLEGKGLQDTPSMLFAIKKLVGLAYKGVGDFTFTYNPETLVTDQKKAIEKSILGNLANYRKTLVEGGATALESTFWKELAIKPKTEGLLSEIDSAQNQQLAAIVRKALEGMGMKGPREGKLNDIEKVAAILNKKELSKEKMAEADTRIRESIKERMLADIAAADGDRAKNAIKAYYAGLLSAWDSSMSRQLNMPVSDAMMRRLVSTELKEAGINLTELVSGNKGDEIAAKKSVIDSITGKLNAASWEGRNYDTFAKWLSDTFDGMLAARNAEYQAAQAKKSARAEAKQSPTNTAEGLINGFARQESDPQIWTESRKNEVRDIVRQDLSQQPDMGRKQPWVSSLTAKLIKAGVSESTAERLAERVWRQHEIKNINREMEARDRAAEAGPLAPIIDAILSTPLSKQAEAGWREKVVIEYLRNSGLSTKDAESVAKLLSAAIDKRFRDAQVKAAEQAVKSYAPWKAREKAEPRKAKSDLDKILAAVRSQALDPTKSFAEELAKQNGWTGFTDAQFKRMSELDAIIEDENANLHDKTKARDELMAIVQQAKLTPLWKDTIGDYYVGMALSGIPTMTINMVSPAAFTVQKALTDGAVAIVSNPANLPGVVNNFMGSLDGWMSEVAYSYKNDSYTNDVNEALETNRVLKRKLEKALKAFQDAKTPAQKAIPTLQIAVGLADYTRRALSSLDQGAITVSQQYNMGRYAMSALQKAGYSAKESNDILTGVLSDKQRFYESVLATGMSKLDASVAANDHARDTWDTVLSDHNIDGAQVMRAAQNDALSEVGRRGPKQEGSTERDEDLGFITSPFFKIISGLQSAGYQSPSTQVLVRMIYGFFSVPARVIHYAAWYSPYGYLRAGMAHAGKKGYMKERYNQSLATDVQMRQRLLDATAGTIVMGLLWGLAKASSDVDDDDRWALVVTGNGPRKGADPAYYDAWQKKWKPWSVTMVINGTRVPFNFGRGFESAMFPLIPAAASDDYAIRYKQNEGKKTPADLDALSEIGGSVFSIIANRGPAAIVTRGLKVNPYSTGSDYAESVAGTVATAARTMVPVFGSSLARNISDLFTMPIDRSSANGVISANTPFAGAWTGKPALNFLGDPTGDQGFDQKLWRLGIPIVVSLSDASPNRKLYELIFEKGQGPIVANRGAVERNLGLTLTDAQWYTYAQTYGRTMASSMNKNYGQLKAMPPQTFNTKLNDFTATATSKATETLPPEYRQKLLGK